MNYCIVSMQQRFLCKDTCCHYLGVEKNANKLKFLLAYKSIEVGLAENESVTLLDCMENA